MGVSVTLYKICDAGQQYEKDTPWWSKHYFEFFNGGTTHNLIEMAEQAGLYNAIWRPYKLFNLSDDEEYSREIFAKNLIDALQLGYDKLLNNPSYYIQYNSSNGWGTYDNFISFVERYLSACKKYPLAIVDVSR